MSYIQTQIAVSIIIPIYNAENFIYGTLSSVCNQTLNNIEIICIDDCSTDCSLSLILDFAEKDSRIKIIQNEFNLGVSLSRNEGLKIATGKYIGFVDHDDMIEKEMYEQLYIESEKLDCDIVHSDVLIHNGINTEVNHYLTDFKNGSIELKNQMIDLLIIIKKSDRFKDIMMYGIWNKIYKREFLIKNYIVFYAEKEYSNEDFLFNLQAFLWAKNVSKISEVYYHHYYHNASLGKTYSYRSFDLRYNSILLAKSFIEKSNVENKNYLYKRLLLRLWMATVFSSSNELKRNPDGRYKAISIILKNIDKPLMKDVVKNINIFDTATNKNNSYKLFELFLFSILKVKLLFK